MMMITTVATILSSLMWMTSSAVISDNNAKTIKYFSDINPDGSYEYLYETDNGIYAEEKGTLQNVNKGDTELSARGSFLYTSPEGIPVHLTYTADKNGFHPEGDHLPTPPPIPPQILRALAWIADQKQKQPQQQQQFVQPNEIKEEFFNNVS